jgi:hypothetical protein
MSFLEAATGIGGQDAPIVFAEDTLCLFLSGERFDTSHGAAGKSCVKVERLNALLLWKRYAQLQKRNGLNGSTTN